MIECSYVESDVQPGVTYFSSKVRLGPEGLQQPDDSSRNYFIQIFSSRIMFREKYYGCLRR